MDAIPQKQPPNLKKPIDMIPKNQQIKIPQSVLDLSDDLLEQYITTKSVEFYHDQPKELQIKSVKNLVRGQTCFLHAGTGYGKTRISEMFFK
jgi:CRISPR/Cas system-associated endonuclease/helicase Cas3